MEPDRSCRAQKHIRNHRATGLPSDTAQEEHLSLGLLHTGVSESVCCWYQRLLQTEAAARRVLSSLNPGAPELVCCWPKQLANSPLNSV